MICFTVDCGLTGYQFETSWQRVRRQRRQLFCAARICDSNLRRIVLNKLKTIFPYSATLSGSESGGDLSTARFFALSGPASSNINSNVEGKTMNALICIRNAAPVFVIALSLVTAAATTTDVIFSFEEDEGEYADTDLERHMAGNIYGTTVLGGEFGGGTVFQLSQTPNGWEQTVLYSFTGGEDGSGPGARVSIDRSGNVYGMAPTGGTYGVGTIYKLHPHAGSWDFQVIHTFTGGDDGATGSAGRMLLHHGRLYGAATAGGMYGSGVVFELTPTPVGEWDFRALYSFHGKTDGSFPYGALLRDGSGKIYGTTYYGGTNGIGAVYELSPRSVGEWDGRVIYSFQTGSDGNSPISNLVRDIAGNLYGTTSEGGLGRGTIFKLTPIGGGQWTESVVHPFQGPPDGGFSYNGMVVDRLGNFYGATVHGGEDDDGCVYKFTP